MDWYRMKTILIILFLGINIFLAALLGYESYSEHRAAKTRTEATVMMLHKSNIKVRGQVPFETPRLRVLTLENPCADKAAFSPRILGEGATQTGDGYEKDGSSLRFTENGFIYESTKEALSPAKKHIATMQKHLEGMGFSMRYAKGQIENGAVVFTQKVDGVPLFGPRLSVVPSSDGSISKMEGTWANVTVSGEKSRVSLSAQALLSFLQAGTNSGETVEKVECGYAVIRTEGSYRTADAVPVWRITTASGKDAFYDARQ